MERMWINSPASTQPYHEYHGTNVLWNPETRIAYFVSGPVESMAMNSLYLSRGWNQQAIAYTKSLIDGKPLETPPALYIAAHKTGYRYNPELIIEWPQGKRKLTFRLQNTFVNPSDAKMTALALRDAVLMACK